MTNDQRLLAEAYKEVTGEPEVVVQERRKQPTAERIKSLKYMLDKLQFSRSEVAINDFMDKVEYYLDKALTGIGMEGPPVRKVYDPVSHDNAQFGMPTTTTESICESWKKVATPENDVYDFLIWAKNTYGDKVIYNESVMDAAVKKLKL